MENLKPETPSQCGYKRGSMPACAPLATAWVPMQEDNSPMYPPQEALTRGTLFPGLDLPFRNMINKSHPYAGTPLGELMALEFMVQDLRLYLDTHPDDADAFKALKETLELCDEGRRRYAKLYGPIQVQDLTECAKYSWLDGPWPWQYCERMGK